jgi:hypothetical protein
LQACKTSSVVDSSSLNFRSEELNFMIEWVTKHGHSQVDLTMAAIIALDNAFASLVKPSLARPGTLLSNSV